MDDSSDWRASVIQQVIYLRDCRSKNSRDLSAANVSSPQPKSRHACFNHCATLKLALSDVIILTKHNPAASADKPCPDYIFLRWFKMIVVDFNGKPAGAQNVRDNISPQRAVDEERSVARQPLVEARSELHPRSQDGRAHSRSLGPECFRRLYSEKQFQMSGFRCRL
jgi:hypothetical protein